MADQATKFLAVSQLTGALDGKSGIPVLTGFLFAPSTSSTSSEDRRTLVPGYADLRYTENHGAALGLMRNLPDGVRRPLTLTVSALALGFLFFLFLRLDPRHSSQVHALAWVIGGAAGNFVDRVFRGYVIDFVELHWRSSPELAGFRWPTFNVADLGIFVGLGLLLREVLRTHGAQQPGSGSGPDLPQPSRS